MTATSLWQCGDRDPLAWSNRCQLPSGRAGPRLSLPKRHVAMDSAAWAALIGGLVALASAGLSAWVTMRVTRRQVRELQQDRAATDQRARNDRIFAHRVDAYRALLRYCVWANHWAAWNVGRAIQVGPQPWQARMAIFAQSGQRSPEPEPAALSDDDEIVNAELFASDIVKERLRVLTDALQDLGQASAALASPEADSNIEQSVAHLIARRDEVQRRGSELSEVLRQELQSVDP